MLSQFCLGHQPISLKSFGGRPRLRHRDFPQGELLRERTNDLRRRARGRVRGELHRHGQGLPQQSGMKPDDDRPCSLGEHEWGGRRRTFRGVPQRLDRGDDTIEHGGKGIGPDPHRESFNRSGAPRRTLTSGRERSGDPLVDLRGTPNDGGLRERRDAIRQGRAHGRQGRRIYLANGDFGARFACCQRIVFAARAIPPMRAWNSYSDNHSVTPLPATGTRKDRAVAAVSRTLTG